MVGDAGVGKTSLMLRYVTGSFEDSYVESLGVSFLEKRIKLPQAEVVMAIWDLAGGREHRAMLPTACAEAVAVLFVFDLTDTRSLRSVRDWFREVRRHSSTARPLLVGTKFDVFFHKSDDFKEKMTHRARKYAQVMGAPLVFSSALRTINVKKMFRLVFNMAFDLPPTIKQMHDIGTPIPEYENAIASMPAADRPAAAAAAPVPEDGVPEAVEEEAEPAAEEETEEEEGAHISEPEPEAEG